MRFLLLLFFLPFASPIATLTVFELSAQIVEITKSLLETWVTINEHQEIIETSDIQREKLIFQELDLIGVQMMELTEQLHGVDNDLNIITKMVAKLPDAVRFELKLNDLQSKQTFVDISYSKMEQFNMYSRDYENSTLIDWANEVVSSNPNSVPYMMEYIYRQVIKKDFLELFYRRFEPTFENSFCIESQSLPQLYLNFLNEILLVNLKSFYLTTGAYMIKKSFKQGQFKMEIQDVNYDFRKRTNNLIAAVKPYIAKSSNVLWRCDPEEHVEGKTFVQLTNLVNGYIINKSNLDPQGSCRGSCGDFSYVKLKRCNNDNSWCQQRGFCPKIIDCHHVDSSMQVCLNDMHDDHRRYGYIKFGNGRVFGQKQSCLKPTYLESYRWYLVYECQYCVCLCDEGPKKFSDRFINLRVAMADYNENRVVTGVRFVKQNQIIHLQVQEGKILPYGQIDVDSIRWVPPENYTIRSKMINGQDYFIFSWEKRSLDLADIIAEPGYVITGVRFRRFGTRIHLQVLTTPYNFTTGLLTPSMSFFEDDPKFAFKHKFGTELKLNKPDIPTRQKSSTDITTDKFVQFTHTDFDKDAAQTTVPFFDAQSVTSAVPVPLLGVGVFHKGRRGSGGFIAPRIFTYNFTQYLEPVFEESRQKRLRN